MGLSSFNLFKFSFQKIKLKIFENGSYARSRKGYFSKRSPLQALTSHLVEAELRGCQGADLQVGEEGPHSFPDRCHSQRFPRSRSGEIRDGNQSSPHIKAKGLASEIPEDLYHMIKKAVSIRKHLERNRKDRDAKFRLILTESRIHRLARYYKTKRVLPPTWKYESSTASALVA